MKPILYSCMFVWLLGASPLAADGLMLPTAKDYPTDFLQNRLTRVTVKIHGLVAETIVYQEFINQWHDTTDVVYSFPLPPGARATKFLYWVQDTPVQAILRVQEQAPNPGTGEGGVAALVNAYIGRNGLKVALSRVPPYHIQRVELHYISVCDYFMGEITYRYPFDTQQFITYPLDHAEFDVEVNSTSSILSFGSPTHEGLRVTENTPDRLRARWARAKVYPTRDFIFRYTTSQTKLSVDFYSVANDTSDGHFALYIRPPTAVDPQEVLPRRLVIMIDNSSRMAGLPIQQSLAAVTILLDSLREQDAFNIVTFNNSARSWQDRPVQATAANRQAAKTFLESVSAASGSRLDIAMNHALQQIEDAAYNNIILLFTNGRSILDPRQVAERNTYRAGIFPIAIEGDPDRAQLEMLAELNYGFVTYLPENENLTQNILRVLRLISHPIMKDTGVEFGRARVSQLFPRTIPSTFAGSFLELVGRYSNPGNSAIAIAGTTVEGLSEFGFRLDFSSDQSTYKFAETLWARAVIDAMEREIQVYPDTEPVLKDSIIALSLRYNIRSRYTAYVAEQDVSGPISSTGPPRRQAEPVPRSYILGNFPNPFNASTLIRFYLSPEAAAAPVKFIKIYNILGQLVRVLDISHLGTGTHQILFDGLDAMQRALPTGAYFVRLIAGDEVDTIRILLIR